MDSYFTPHTKINSTLIKDLTVRAEIIKLTEENRATFYDPGLGNSLLDTTLKAQQQKKKHKLDFIKINNFWVSEDIINSEETTHTMGEDIYLAMITSRIHKNSRNLIIKNQITQFKSGQ